MTDHQPLPVKGYTSQGGGAIDMANEGKIAEERYLRYLDKLAAHPDTDKRMVAIAKTDLQSAAMWAVRSIFQPERVELPEDSGQ